MYIYVYLYDFVVNVLVYLCIFNYTVLHIPLVGLQKPKHVAIVFIATVAYQLHTKAYNHITSLFTLLGYFRKSIQQRKAQQWLIVTQICDLRV